LCCDVGLVSEFSLTAGCVLMDLASPAASQAAVYANGLKLLYDSPERYITTIYTVWHHFVVHV